MNVKYNTNPAKALTGLIPIGFWLVFCLLPTTAMALDISWTNSPNDKSISYLCQIFGNVSTALVCSQSNPIVGSLFNIFNIAVLTLGSLVVGYTIILSAINTAQEGEVMGKKWSSIWIPFRSAIGVAFLLPTASGYSLLQILTMNIVVLGVAGANALCYQVIQSMQSGTGLFGQIRMNFASSTSSDLLSMMVCAQVINDPKNAACQNDVGNQIVSPYVSGNSLYVGVQNSAQFASVCGNISPGPMPTGNVQPSSLNAWNTTNLSAFAYAVGYLAGPASEIEGGTTTPSYTNIYPTTNNILLGTISATPLNPPPSGNSQQQAMKNAGWIFAGTYYFVLIKQNQSPDWSSSAPHVTYNPQGLSPECSNQVTAAINAMGAYTRQSEVSANIGQPSKLSFGTGGGGGGLMAPFVNAIDSPMMQLTQQVMGAIAPTNQDPIVALQTVGSNILIAAETLWFSIMGAAAIALGIGCIGASESPTCWQIGAALSVLVPIVTALIALLWTLGSMLGIYTPLVPYLVFNFTAIGWLLLVIEAMVAAPIVALGLVSPSQENLGRASPAVLIITNIFLRPSLMILGFIASTYLLRAGVAMLNYGFIATVQASIGNLGMFGSIGLIMLYGGIVLSLISEAFSLVHVLPDKVIRWIGGTAESAGVKEKMGEAKQAAGKGAEAAAGIMKGAGGYLGGELKEQRKEGKEKAAAAGVAPGHLGPGGSPPPPAPPPVTPSGGGGAGGGAGGGGGGSAASTAGSALGAAHGGAAPKVLSVPSTGGKAGPDDQALKIAQRALRKVEGGPGSGGAGGGGAAGGGAAGGGAAGGGGTPPPPSPSPPPTTGGGTKK